MATSDELRQAQLHFEAAEREKRVAEIAEKIRNERGEWIRDKVEYLNDPKLIEAVVDKTAEMSALERTEPGRQSFRDLENIIPDAVNKVELELNQQLEAVETIQAQTTPENTAAVQLDPQAPPTQELLSRDRDHTDIHRYDELKALSEAQSPQGKWQPTAIEVCGPTKQPHSPAEPAEQPQDQDLLKDMMAQGTSAAASHEQHDCDLMRDFVSQEVKDQAAAQERQLEAQRQRDHNNNMTI